MNTYLLSPTRARLNSIWQAASGNNPQVVRLFGRNPNPPITPASMADLWIPGGVRGLPTSTFVIGVVSDDANDAAAGSGAQQVAIPYLDGNWNAQTALVNLNGQTAVNVALNAIRINPPYVTKVGSGGSNAGNIYVYDHAQTVTSGVPAGGIYAQVAPGDNRAHQALYTVPASQQAAILSIRCSVTAGTTTAFFGRIAKEIALFGEPFFRSIIDGPSSNADSTRDQPVFPDLLPQQTDLRFQGSASAANGELSIDVELVQWAYPGTQTP